MEITAHQVIAWLLFCIENDLTVTMCRPMWDFVSTGMIGAGLLLLAVCLWRAWVWHRNAEEVKRMRERAAFVDVEAIDAARWRGEDPDVLLVDVSEEVKDLAAVFRESLTNRKMT